MVAASKMEAPSAFTIIGTTLLGVGTPLAVLMYYASKIGRANAHLNVKTAEATALEARKQQDHGSNAASKVGVDSVFLKRFLKIWPIIFPSIFSREAGWMFLVAVMMIARTYCDLLHINNFTAIENAIIGRNKEDFLKYFAIFMMTVIPVAFINNSLKYGLWMMHLCFRERLTHFLYKEYLKGFTFYQISNLDNRITNCDQLLTQDIDKFAHSVSDLYSNMSKPLLDMIIYTRRLSDNVGKIGPFAMLSYLALSGVFMTSLRRPVGKMTVVEQRLEGDYRFVNSRLLTNAEEISFYSGNDKEKRVIDTAWNRLYSHLTNVVNFRFVVGLIDTVVTKYVATAVAYIIVARPFLNLNEARLLGMTENQLMQDYFQSGRMMFSLAGAVGRLVLSGRELNRLAGFTARVTELRTVLNDLNNGKYERTMVKEVKSKRENLIPNSGKITEQDYIIEFKDVPIVTPNKDVLVESLNFKITKGMDLMVVGPNGCGKSSLFRMLGGLWPLWGGELTKPHQSKLFYVPQKPYLVLGSLRDQVIYPHSKPKEGWDDGKLSELLDSVFLKNLVEREGGWNTVQDWNDVLSGGEKQKLAMARLFYHSPQFAILDECTSALSIDVEAALYERAKQLQITLVTVSHRKTLWKYHSYILRFDGRGAISFAPMTEDDIANAFGS